MTTVFFNGNPIGRVYGGRFQPDTIEDVEFEDITPPTPADFESEYELEREIERDRARQPERHPSNPIC